MKLRNKLSSLLLTAMLIMTMALCMTACDDKSTEETKNNEADVDKNHNDSDSNVLGEGKTKFNFTVVDKDGNETAFEIHTDKKTVGDALFEHNLIEGEAGDYGLYVKKVNGITADYDADKTYWAFYIDGEYAMSGVDSTDVEAGKTYTFKVEK